MRAQAVANPMNGWATGSLGTIPLHQIPLSSEWGYSNHNKSAITIDCDLLPAAVKPLEIFHDKGKYFE